MYKQKKWLWASAPVRIKTVPCGMMHILNEPYCYFCLHHFDYRLTYRPSITSFILIIMNTKHMVDYKMETVLFLLLLFLLAVYDNVTYIDYGIYIASSAHTCPPPSPHICNLVHLSVFANIYKTRPLSLNTNLLELDWKRLGESIWTPPPHCNWPSHKFHVREISTEVHYKGIIGVN